MDGVSPQPASAPAVASLSDETIRRTRIGVMIATGVPSAIIGISKSVELAPDATWDQVNGLSWAIITAGCFASVVLTSVSRLKASEVLMLLTAYFGAASMIVTESSHSALAIGIAALSLIVVLPGVTFRISSPRASAINLMCACAVYTISVLLRLLLRDDRGVEQSDAVLILVVPNLGLAIQWMMCRALTRRVLEALRESEQSRRDVRRALDRQVSLNDALVRFVPQEFLTSLGRNDLSEVRLGDSATKTVSILFADIRGYTKLVEGMAPGTTVQFLNEVFGALEPAIHDHHGFVDSYIGDAIMALFDRSPRDAIDAALAMLAALRRYNEGRVGVGEAGIGIGIGINTGPVTLGTVGGPKSLKCSVFGDSVNLAARIEQLTRRYDTPLLVSGQTLDQVGDGSAYAVRLVDKVRVVGRTTATTLFEIYDADPEPQRGHKRRVDDDFQAGVSAYYERRFAEALAAFERCREEQDDAVLRAFSKRSRALRDSPPDGTWTGVEILDQK